MRPNVINNPPRTNQQRTLLREKDSDKRVAKPTMAMMAKVQVHVMVMDATSISADLVWFVRYSPANSPITAKARAAVKPTLHVLEFMGCCKTHWEP
jgi:hypothetical protein